MANFDSREQKAFDFAQDTVKQFLTLSTGIFALTLTFLKDILPKGTDTGLLQWAWGGYLASILFGLLGLMTLTGTLGDVNGDVNRTAIRVLVGIQILLFFVALFLTLLFGLHVF